MDNNQKVEFIVQLEKKHKRKRIATWIAALIFFGALMIFFQVMNYQPIE